jgi:hypothetical protein
MMANLSTMKATTGILQSSFKVKKKWVQKIRINIV